MIADLETKTLIVTPPKCACTSLHKFFCEQHKGIYIVGPSGADGRVDKHTPITPMEFEGWRKLLVVRHPLDRLVSLWHHCVRYRAREYAAGTWDFAEHVDRCNDDAILDWFFSWDISRLVSGHFFDGYISCENLEEQLRSFDLLYGAVPRENAEYRKPWRDYFKERSTLEKATAWAKRDADRFGYAIEL